MEFEKSTKLPIFQRVSDLCAKIVAWHFTTDEVIHFVMDILGNGVDSNKENMSGEEGDAEVDPASVSGGDSD